MSVEAAWQHVLELEERGDPAARSARRRYLLRFALPRELLGLAVLLALAALNVLWFSLAGGDYFEWFLDNGALVALVFGVVTTAVDLDRNPGLIAADPLGFEIGVIRVFLELSTSLWGLFGAPRSDRALEQAGLTEVQTRFRSRLVDYLLSNLFMLVLGAAMLAWALVIAPLQYFVNLLCGAPARVALASRTTTYRVQRSPSHTEYVNAPKDTPEIDGTELTFAARPVSFTAAIAAAFLFALSRL
jgi:hypothetical protein